MRDQLLAWGTITGATGVISAQNGGIASVTRNGAGDYTIVPRTGTGWDAAQCEMQVQVRGTSPIIATVNPVSDTSWNVLLFDVSLYAPAGDGNFDVEVRNLA